MSVVLTQNLAIGYRKGSGQTFVQQYLNLQLEAGKLVCLIGPNGSGKSTLMRTMAGLQKPLSGIIEIDNKNITKLKPYERARKIALVLTDRVSVENATVWDIIAMGRHPYSHWLGGMTKESKKKIAEAIRFTNLQEKSKLYFDELSDGEKQRVMIAKALAQDTPVIFLDEPTAHLDLPNRVEVMLLLHRLAHATNKAILISTHELDIALQSADYMWLMRPEKGIVTGVPEDLVLNDSFNSVFGHPSYFFNVENGNFSMNYPYTKDIGVEGESVRLYWTIRALARKGYRVKNEAKESIKITEKGWIYENNLYSTLEDLLKIL